MNFLVDFTSNSKISFMWLFIFMNTNYFLILFFSFACLLYFGLKKFIGNKIEERFNRDFEVFKSKIENDLQNNIHFHRIISKSIFEKSNEFQSRKYKSIEQVWKSFLILKKYSVITKFLSGLNINKFEKLSEEKLLKCFPEYTFDHFLKENSDIDLYRVWLSNRAYELYQSYRVIINYSILSLIV